MLRILAMAVLPLALGGCAAGHVELDEDALQRQMSTKGWVRDTRLVERGVVIPFSPEARPADEMVQRASSAWGIGPRPIRKVINSGSGLDPSRLDLLAAASASSGIPARALVSAMVATSKIAVAHEIAFPHHLAMVATLAMFDPEPHKVQANFRAAAKGLASASIPGEPDGLGLGLPGRIQVLDRWRRSHEAGAVRDGCLDEVIEDPHQRHAVSLLLQDAYMVVFCDLVGRFGCSDGLAWQQLRAYPLPDGVQQEETWRVSEFSRQLLMWADR